MRPSPLWHAILFGLLIGGCARTGDSSGLDWDTWEKIPVLHDGRVKPLDSFARSVVRSICGREHPRLSLAGALGPGEEDSRLGGARALFPEGKPRRLRASEILFSWLVEPELWERIPLLPATNEVLRRDVLGLPLEDLQGERLRFVSPWQLNRSIRGSGSSRFHAHLNDPSVGELLRRHDLYYAVVLNLRSPRGPRARLVEQVEKAIRSWRELEPAWALTARGGAESGQSGQTPRIGEALEHLEASLRSGQVSSEQLGPALEVLARSASVLEDQLEGLARRLEKDPPQLDPEQLKTMRSQMQALRHMAAQAAELTDQAQLYLAQYTQYGNRCLLAVVPSLDPKTLTRNRDPKQYDVSAWLGLAEVLWAPEAALAGYPKGELAEVRKAFKQVAAAYQDRGGPDRPQRFSAAMDRFARALATLGKAIEPLRQKLVIDEPDEELIARTAYPEGGSTRLEVHYNRLDPFLWTWVLSLAAFFVFLASVGRFRVPGFWLGMGLLGLGQLITIYGFALRTIIAGRTPVATMFETVVFVALVVALLGIWFACLPLASGGLRLAWQATAFAPVGEAGPRPHEPNARATGPVGRWARALVLVARAALAAGVFSLLALVPYGSGKGEPAVLLWPRVAIGATMPTVGEWIIWLVGLGVLAVSLYYLPRAMLAGLLALGTIPYVLFKQGLGEPLRQVILRKPFAMAGAAVAFLAGYAGYYSPIFEQEITNVHAILRHSFWLTSHVLTITASYGAGALAWALGNVALGYYLFGRYRDPAALPASGFPRSWAPAEAFESPERFAVRRAPEACATLASFIYKAIQVAVLLLFVGTVLGAAWADVAWGRYWGWDPKEVWALVSLLVYLVVLHGRYTGWSGNFGLAVGSVIGATSIMMAWYGVNYVIRSGKHSYGEGAGGLTLVLGAVALNWTYVLAAALRYWIETRLLARPDRSVRPPA